MTRVLVTGAAGFIGHHLCNYLKERGYWVRAVDTAAPKYGVAADEKDWNTDLRFISEAAKAFRAPLDEVYHLAADMGGMGYIGTAHLNIMLNNMRINANVARLAPERLLFSSSACVYPERLQRAVWANALSEEDAWHGKPDTAYGIEKLMAEELFGYLAFGTGTEVRIARFHNIYGRECHWNDGREKAPAALCRKVADAKREGHGRVEIWGDGKQTRSFCHISDCLEMLHRLMRSQWSQPVNIGTSKQVSIDDLADIIAAAAEIKIEKIHIPGPEGVRGRNADLARMEMVLDYRPAVTLEDGMKELYEWVAEPASV